MTLKRFLTYVVVMTLALLPLRMEAQAPSGDQIRARIRSSGMSEEQIRQRLQSAGYSANLLDAYLNEGSGPAPEPTQDILAALSNLNAAPASVEGLEAVMPKTGAASRPRAPDDGRDEGLKVFGLDVFRGQSTQFQPLLAGPVPESYRLGAGDLLVLVLSGDVELVHNLEVTRDGFVLVPQVGQLYVGSLTMAQLKTALRQRLGASYSGIRTGSTTFDVTLARLRTNQVYVIGEVVQPGAYQLASVATVLNALYAAGGPTERGGMRAIRVERQGKTVAVFDLYDYLLRGNTVADVTLEMGDVVFVPVHGVRASVRGAVIRPAVYELAAGQTMADLVAAAGGFTPEAALRRISISRVVPPEQRVLNAPDRIVLDVPVSQVMGGRAPVVPIEPGDEVRVFSVPQSERGYVKVEGAVYSPGTFGWRPGLRLSELVKLAGGVTPAVYGEIAHISRLNVADSTRFLLRVSVPPDSLTPWAQDVEVQEFDEIRVYGRDELRGRRVVHIDGVVRRAGEYPYVEGMTLRDLVLTAGGLRDGALLDSVEIARLPRQRSGGELALTFRAQMDSSYLFEPDSTTFRFLPGLPSRARGAPEVTLEPYDRVSVFIQPDWELQRTVRVLGEVLLPGPYALNFREERLSSIIRRAGGLKKSSFIEGARLVRAADSAGPVNIDLAEAMRRPGGNEDIILRPGDEITVPEYNAVVRVVGAVVSPMSVQYRPGKDLAYYVANAGGYARNADKGRVSVRYANGSAETTDGWWFTRRSPEMRPGATVSVPVKPDDEPFKLTEFLAASASILASTVAIIAIASR